MRRLQGIWGYIAYGLRASDSWYGRVGRGGEVGGQLRVILGAKPTFFCSAARAERQNVPQARRKSCNDVNFCEFCEDVTAYAAGSYLSLYFSVGGQAPVPYCFTKSSRHGG